MKRIKRVIARMVIASCDLAIALIDKALSLPPSAGGAQSPPMQKPRSTNRILSAPWPPGVDHRSVMEGKRFAWFLLRPGASTPPDVYLAYWKTRTRRKEMACAN